jgi:uncharacterized protein YmfQ (DUF2313 family)
MARTALQYARMLKNLLPRGRIWSKSENSVLFQVLHGAGEEFSRLEGRMDDLLLEAIPSTATELLTEWETEFAIAEPKTTTALRRGEIKAQLIAVGGQNPQYYIDIAAELGYSVTIQEFEAALCGIVVCGEPVGGLDNIFHWLVYIDPTDAGYVESRMTNLTLLINEIKTRKPAHTRVLFDFNGVAFDRGFGRGFNRKPHYDNSWIELDFNNEFSNAFANNTDYDGVNYVGAFDQDFTIAFDRYSGGDFESTAFGDAFIKPD